MPVDGLFYDSSGIPFQIQAVGIDSGDAADGRSEVVYRFCERWVYAMPIKGFAKVKARRGDSADTDIPGERDFKKYRVARIGSGGEYVIEVATAYYKSALFSRLNIERTKQNPSPAAYCDFPADYPADYFVQLTNSEKLDRNVFRDIGAHEAMDCRIYNFCMADYFLDRQVSMAREVARRKGADPILTDMQITTKTVLFQMEAGLLARRAALA